VVPQRAADTGITDRAVPPSHLRGKDFSYFDFRAPFDRNAAKVDFADWAQFFTRAGARYVVMVTRHLDGYPLWPTTVANPHMPPTTGPAATWSAT
jgi:alpha-L-fucosidase